MEELVNQFPHALYWVTEMQKDSDWKEVRFKMLNVGYPKFILFPHLFDKVEYDVFLEKEQKRIPLFIGSQFGINPRLEEIFSNLNENRIIAVLCKSLLSGVVAGLKIYSLQENYTIKEIAFFRNVNE